MLLPVRSVGVMGDGRTYDFVCSLRAVTSVDGMTADFYPFDNDFLGETSNKIINEVKLKIKLKLFFMNTPIIKIENIDNTYSLLS